MELGEEIGRGARSIVYALGDDDALKLPNPDVPTSWIVEEHRLTGIVASCGVDVPARRRLVEVAGTTALASERIEGPSMWQRLVAAPGDAASLGAELAEVQRRIAEAAPSFALPSQRDRLVSKIESAARLHGAGLRRALRAIGDDDGPLVVCHGDLHPRNVIASPGGRTVVVDWFDVSRGRIEGEIARTALVLEDVRDVGGRAEPELASAWDVLAAAYLERACAAAGIEPSQLAGWSIAQRVARLAEGFGVDRVDALSDELALT